MSVVPLWLRCLLAAVLIVSLALAFWARPPRRRPRVGTWRRIAAGAAACYGAGCGALLVGEAAISAALVGVGVEALSVAAWLGRALGEDDGDGGGGGGSDDDDPTDRDKGGSGDGWDPRDEQEFWDYVARQDRERVPR